MVGVVGDHEDSRHTLGSLEVGGYGGDTQASRLARLNLALVERNLQAHGEHLERTDVEGRLAGIDDGDVATKLLLACERTEVEGVGGELDMWSYSQLVVAKFLEVGQENGRNLDGFVGRNLVTLGKAKVDVGLRESEVAKLVGIERYGNLARTTRTDGGWRHFGREIRRQVHDLWLRWLVAGVEDVDGLIRTRATIYIIKLYIVVVDHQSSKGVRIATHEVGDLFDNDATNCEAQRFEIVVESEVSTLGEMPHGASIVGGGDGIRGVALNYALRSTKSGASAIGIDVVDMKRFACGVLQFEGYGDRLLEFYLSEVNKFLSSLDGLCRGYSRSRHEQGSKDGMFFCIHSREGN